MCVEEKEEWKGEGDRERDREIAISRSRPGQAGRTGRVRRETGWGIPEQSVYKKTGLWKFHK